MIPDKTETLLLKCKADMSYSSGGKVWEPVFISGNWYSVEATQWWSEETKRLNGGGWRKHLVTTENGKLREMTHGEMRAIFHYTEIEQRDAKLSELI